MTSAPIYITGAQIATPDGLVPGTITIIGENIVDVSNAVGAAAGKPRRANFVQATGLIAAPGFIDLQINGGFGLDLCRDPSSMWELGRQLPRHGVTGFLPTIITAPFEAYDAAIEALQARPAGYVGAEPLGLHFEGPMLNPQRRGAHCLDHLLQPGPEVIAGWSRHVGVALVTIAPELPGAMGVIAELAQRGVVVAAGHTNATAGVAKAGLAAGMTAVTHLFNAMAPLGHRTPNLVGVALTEPELIVGLIVDGVHIDPVVVAATWKAKGPGGVVLVTDAVAAMGQDPGVYELAGTSVTADPTSVRQGDGTLAGSILTMDQAVRNLIAYTRCATHRALTAATSTPADLLGEDRRGRVKANTTADLVLLDKNLEVQLTLCAGRISHVTEEARGRLPNPLRKVS